VEIARRQLGENTRAVHLPPPPDTAQRPVGTPVHRTASFTFGSAAEYAAVLNDQVPGYSYSRIDNPTVDAFARAVAALEGANLSRWPAAQGFASGMAAISGVLQTFLRAGAHVVCSSAVYGGTYSLLRNLLSRFGVETSFVDIADLDAVRAAMQPATRIVYAETIANPTTAVADLRKLADLAHNGGALLVVDSTLAPPVICRPLEHGADLVIHSATKYIGGHSDVTARSGRCASTPAGRCPPMTRSCCAGAWRRCRCGCAGSRRPPWCSPPRSPGTPRYCALTTRGWRPTRSMSWPGGCSTPGRRGCGSARS
jgi:O-acetylhomoserine/O-acetylserine sulfhydrylase-like pyridoxal-dependent enzyme